MISLLVSKQPALQPLRDFASDRRGSGANNIDPLSAGLPDLARENLMWLWSDLAIGLAPQHAKLIVGVLRNELIPGKWVGFPETFAIQHSILTKLAVRLDLHELPEGFTPRSALVSENGREAQALGQYIKLDREQMVLCLDERGIPITAYGNRIVQQLMFAKRAPVSQPYGTEKGLFVEPKPANMSDRTVSQVARSLGISQGMVTKLGECFGSGNADSYGESQKLTADSRITREQRHYLGNWVRDAESRLVKRGLQPISRIAALSNWDYVSLVRAASDIANSCDQKLPAGELVNPTSIKAIFLVGISHSLADKLSLRMESESQAQRDP